MRIKKSFFYKNLRDIFGKSCNMFLHGISEDPDIPNEFSHMDSENIAKRIMQEGLYNNYHGTIVRTCLSFGRLSDSMLNKYQKFTNYLPYKTEGKKINVVVAIPTCFVDEDNNKFFGGWIEPNNYLHSYNSLLDFTLNGSRVIPKEFVLGYFKHDVHSDELDFTLNKGHYYFLTKEEQTKFIKETKLNKMFNIDNDYPDFYAMSLPEGIGYTFLEQLKKFNKENSFIITNLDFDNFNFKNYPSIDELTYGEIDIRKELINHSYHGYNFLADIAFYQYNPELVNQEVEVDYFENWVRSYGNDPKNLYEYLYNNFPDEVLEIYNQKKLNGDAPSLK